MINILIVGATSSIASHCARIWASERAQLTLLGRDTEKLEATKSDLTARGAVKVHTLTFDASQTDMVATVIQSAISQYGPYDLALVAHGILPVQAECQSNARSATHQFEINATSVIAALTEIAIHMRERRQGTIVVLSSVAGDRGRQSNYHYGSAKAAISTFCDGLRAELYPHGVHVLTVKPGFVDTPMTASLKLPQALVTDPGKVANDVARAIRRKKNVLYTPFWWALIMLIIRLIPGPIFKRLKL